MIPPNETRPMCHGRKMAKNDWIFSGRNKRRRWKCLVCGRTTIIMPKTEK